MAFSGWRQVCLADVAELTVGHVGSMAQEYVSSGVPFLRSLNVEPYRINADDMAFISHEFHAKLQKSCLRPGDLVIVRTGKPGACAVIPDWLGEANCSDVVIVRPGPETDQYFVMYYINSVSNRHVVAHLVGAVQQHFNVGSAKQIPIILPPLGEQRCISRTLRTLDEKINLNRQVNATLEQIAKVLFQAWFEDFLPVRAKAAAHAEGRNPLRAAMCALSGKEEAALDAMPRKQYEQLAATANLFPDEFVDSDVASVPQGWEVRELDHLAALQTSSISPAKHGDELFEHYSIPAFDEHVLPAIERGFVIKSNKYKVDPAAVLVSKLNPNTPRVWLPAVKTTRAVCSTEFMQFVPRNTDGRLFLYLLMQSEAMQSEILMRVTGSTGSRQRAQPGQIAMLPIIHPPRELICAFEVAVRPMLDLVALNREQSATLAELRDTLLPKLLSGEIRIDEAQELAEIAA